MSQSPHVADTSLTVTQLYILKETVLANEYDSSRALAILHAIHRAIITSPEPLPDTEFAFSVADIVEDPEELRRPTWGLARKEKEEEIWLMSDFGYWSWPLDLVGGYDEIRREISDAEIDFAAKKKQAVWRGALATNEHRPELIRATEGKEWADVKAISWAGVSELTPEDQGKAISMPQHCQYQFVIHTEGKFADMSTQMHSSHKHRTQLLGTREVSAELQLGSHHAQAHLDRVASLTAGGGRAEPELCRGRGGLLRLGGEGSGVAGRPRASGADLAQRRAYIPGSVSDTGSTSVLLARVDQRLGRCQFCAGSVGG